MRHFENGNGAYKFKWGGGGDEKLVRMHHAKRAKNPINPSRHFDLFYYGEPFFRQLKTKCSSFMNHEGLIP